MPSSFACKRICFGSWASHFRFAFFLPKHLRSLLSALAPPLVLASSTRAYRREGVLEMPLTERDTNIPPKPRTQTPPTHKAPQPHSRLPRLVATPNSAPAVTKWTSRVVDPSASAEKPGSALRHTPTLRRDPTAIESSQKVSPPTPPLVE